MLSKLIKNSDKLIKSQFDEDKDFIGQVLKMKRKSKNNSFFQSPKNKNSIFSQPDFLQKINIKQLKRNNRISSTNSYRIRQQSHRINNYPQKLKSNILTKQKSEQKLKFGIGSEQLTNRKNKIIHSLIIDKNKLLNKSKTPQKTNIKHKNEYLIKKHLIQQPGFINLCFYKNKLQELQKIKTLRASETRNQGLRKQKKCQTHRNKLKLHQYKKSTLQKSSQCRPWSTVIENQANQTELILFKSLLIKN